MKEVAEIGILVLKLLTIKNCGTRFKAGKFEGRKIGSRKINADMRVRPSFCALCFCHLVLNVPIDDLDIERLSEYRRRPIDAGTL